MDCSRPGSSAHGISQARALEWVAIPFSRGSSWPRDWTWVCCISGRFFTLWATVVGGEMVGGPKTRGVKPDDRTMEPSAEHRWRLGEKISPHDLRGSPWFDHHVYWSRRFWILPESLFFLRITMRWNVSHLKLGGLVQTMSERTFGSRKTEFGSQGKTEFKWFTCAPSCNFKNILSWWEF